MKPITLICIVIFSGCLLRANQNAQNSPNTDLIGLGNGIAAIVEGQIITLEKLRRELAPVIPRLQVESKNEKDFSQRIEKLSKQVLQNMIDRIIIVKAAEDKGLLIPPSYVEQEYDDTIDRDFGGDRSRFLEYLRARGETTREFRKNIYESVVVNVMRSENRRSQSEISPEQIEDFYVKNKIRFYQHEALHLRQIILTSIADEGLIPLRQTAKKIISELDNGANFGDVARKYSQDKMSRSGGDWGWIERNDIRADLSDTAFGLKTGNYSQPIEIEGTIFILYAENKRDEMIQPVSEVRDIIENVLIGEIARETQEKWLEEIRSEAYVRYFM